MYMLILIFRFVIRILKKNRSQGTKTEMTGIKRESDHREGPFLSDPVGKTWG